MPDEVEWNTGTSPDIAMPGAGSEAPPGRIWAYGHEIVLSVDQVRSGATYDALWDTRRGQTSDTLLFAGYPYLAYSNGANVDPLSRMTPSTRRAWRLIEQATDSVRHIADAREQARQFVVAIRRLDPERSLIHSVVTEGKEGCLVSAVVGDNNLHTSFEFAGTSTQFMQRGTRFVPPPLRHVDEEKARIRAMIRDGDWFLFRLGVSTVVPRGMTPSLDSLVTRVQLGEDPREYRCPDPALGLRCHFRDFLLDVRQAAGTRGVRQ